MSRRSRRALLVVTGATILALILLLQRCRIEPPGPPDSALLVPEDLARRFDRDGILRFVREEIARSDYAGILRGAHGALWAGAANAWDRILLAAAALEAEGVEARVLVEDPPALAFRDGDWYRDSLEPAGGPVVLEDLPGEAVRPEALPSTVPDRFHWILPTLELVKDARVERYAPERPERLEEWVREPVLLEVVTVDEGGASSVRYVLTVGERVVLESEPFAQKDAGHLALTAGFGDRSTTWRRELFHRSNTYDDIVGHYPARPGDRYAVVANGGRFVPEVLATRRSMLASRDFTPVADSISRDLVLLGTEYFTASDARSDSLAARADVELRWTEPRLAVAAFEWTEDGEESLSIDVIANAVDAAGPGAAAVQTARGFANDQVEAEVLFGVTRRPVISATAIFSHVGVPPLATVEGRVAAIRREAERMLREEPAGTRIGMRVLRESWRFGEGSEPGEGPLLRIERTEGGLDLLGVRAGEWVGGRDRYYRFGPEPGGREAFEDDAEELARVAESVLGRRSVSEARGDSLVPRPIPDYLLGFEPIERPFPADPVALTNGSLLTYRVERGGRVHRFVAEVSFEDGGLSGAWSELTGGRRGALDDAALLPVSWEPEGPRLAGLIFPPDSAPTVPARWRVRVGAADETVDVLDFDLEGRGRFRVLAPPYPPLLAEWSGADGRVVLESASAVVGGRVVDAATGRGIGGSAVKIPSRFRASATAADGSFRIPAEAPVSRRLVLVLDGSASMRFGLAPGSDEDAPSGQRRADALRRAVRGVLERVPPGVEVAIWSFALPEVERGSPDPCDAAHAKRGSFTDDREEVARAVDELEFGGGTPTTGAVRAMLDHVRSTPASAQAVFVLLTDGQNDCTDLTMADAYTEADGRVTIHTVGFAIEAGAAAERQLRELARASGGSYRTAREESDLRLVFEEFVRTDDEGPIVVSASSAGYAATEAEWEADSASSDLEIRLAPERSDFLTVTHEDLTTCYMMAMPFACVPELDRVQGLSEKANDLILERLETEGWSVTLPLRRSDIASVSAMGWFERHAPTGRVVGRTEDGLHGATVGAIWRPREVVEYQSFVAWFQGVTAYTAGSVQAGLSDWRRQSAAARAGGPEAFKRFVQAHALQFSLDWFGELGVSAASESGAAYWSGVCLNFALQSESLQLPAASCSRTWAYVTCRDYVSALPGALAEEIEGRAREDLDEESQAVLDAALDALRQAGLDDLAAQLQGIWDREVAVSACRGLLPD